MSHVSDKQKKTVHFEIITVSSSLDVQETMPVLAVTDRYVFSGLNGITAWMYTKDERTWCEWIIDIAKG